MTAYAFKQEDLDRVQRECKARARARKARTANFGTAPKFRPGMSTADYIAVFSIGRNVLPFDFARYQRPAPFLSPREDEVVVETESDEVFA